MRKYTIVKKVIPMNDHGDLVKKIMINSTKEDGVYVFLYTTTQEYGRCSADCWFEDLQSAEEYASNYSVEASDWIFIDDPLPNCQHDCIHPIRMKGRKEENPVWGKYEIFNGVEWIDFVFEDIK